jgi:hypothetical protein
MSPLALLLRVLLCIALILNGSVPAVHAAMAPADAPSAMHHASMDRASVDHASVGHASMGHASMDPASAIASKDAGAGGCHDAAPADQGPPPAPAPDADGGCCGDDGDCRSTCAQHCAVSIPAFATLNLSQWPAAGPLPMTAAPHPAPRLRDRIRPPIA